jgi:DNA repair protein RadC
MKDLDPHDRPREKLVRIGASQLGDNELLALIVGAGTRDEDAIGVANQVLHRSGGLEGLTRASVGHLRRVTGVGAARAARIVAAIELGRRTLVRRDATRRRLRTPKDIAEYLLPLHGSGSVEQFGIVMLDTRHALLQSSIVTTGGLDQTVVHPREVFKAAALESAAAVVLFHNHPSGDPSPSEADLALTLRLVQAGAVMGIEVLDHLILANQRYYSFWEAGRMATFRPAGTPAHQVR